MSPHFCAQAFGVADHLLSLFKPPVIAGSEKTDHPEDPATVQRILQGICAFSRSVPRLPFKFQGYPQGISIVATDLARESNSLFLDIND